MIPIPWPLLVLLILTAIPTLVVLALAALDAITRKLETWKPHPERVQFPKPPKRKT